MSGSDCSPLTSHRFHSVRDCPEPVSHKDIEVAEYLMDRKLHLSALEYYFEQLERGKRINLLQNFFTDLSLLDMPFPPLGEETQCAVAHYQSVSTLDSVDIGRTSDDGNGLEDKLKEYELRKKNEEIQSLRNELTTITMGRPIEEVCHISKPDEDSELPKCALADEDGRIRPYELRAMSVLIHEQLLELGYRMTAVQFAEESESNGILDVDSWRHVGINLPKPPKLLRLLRSYWSGNEYLDGFYNHFRLREVGIQTDPWNGESDLLGPYSYSGVDLELRVLQSKVAALELENSQLQAQSQHWRNQFICLEREHAELSFHLRSSSPDSNRLIELGQLEATLSAPPSDSQCTDSVAVLPLQDFDEVTGNDCDKRATAHQMIRRPLGQSLHSRSPSDDFRNHMINMLPKHENFSGCECDVFSLAASLDELVIFVTNRLEMVLTHLSNEGKVLVLPLLTQLICLHSMSPVRDRLLRVLFNLFGPQFNRVGSRTSMSSPTYSPSTHSGSERTALSDCNQHRALILHSCHLIASYLGPTRLESELIPQLWSQLNERPLASSSKRLLLVSACGAISPCIPTHLRSSLMLSILESNLDEEHNEVVAAAAIRSLAGLITLMTDCDKLPQCIQRLTQLLLRGHPSEQCVRVANLSPTDATRQLATPDEKRASAVRPTFTATLDWLLPAVAQWCLELDSLHTTLIDPWLDHVDSYLLNSRKSGADVPHEMATRCLGILEQLTPFLYAWLLITMIEPDCDSGEPTHWMAAQRYANKQHDRETNKELSSRLSEPLSGLSNRIDSRVHIDAQLVLGKEMYSALEPLLKRRLRHVDEERVVALEDSSSPNCYSSPVRNGWPAKFWLDKLLLPKVCELLMCTPRASIVEKVRTIGTSLYKHGDLLETFVNAQYGEHFACPWSVSPQSDLMVVCLCACRFLATFGRSMSVDGTRLLLSIPIRNQLMNKTELGNYEYDHSAMQTGLLAAYCCLLSSTRAKSESNKVRMLLTNAIFLHTREGYPLDSIRLTIWCLCLTIDLEYAVGELLLPALRPCVSCADSIVRRAVATLLHSLIEALRFAKLNRFDHGCLDRNTGSNSRVLDQVFQLVSQLARDDLTGQRRRLNPDEADWSVLAVSLGPLYSFFSLCRTTLSPPGITPGVIGLGADGIVSFSSTEPPNSGGREIMDLEEQILELVELQFSLVSGMLEVDVQSGSMQDAEHPGASSLLITKQRFWTTLTHSLISLADHLIPVCPDGFRDKVLLPWLYQLAEMSNSLPNLSQRARLADRLFALFSTAAYSVQLEESLLLWLVPGLDRVRLDLIEAGDVRRSHEVEQLLNDLYSRIKADETEPNAPDLKGLRNTVSQQLTRLTHRSNRTADATSSLQQPNEMIKGQSLPRPFLGRLSRRKR
ncbi:LisH domain and HEAT repeat-containing protein [Fasciola hepatica]|uniref:LisH domain and HEAT repeat-containing protein n=1 Tax=Fasciola hepatica TaxID=6192 RepID=A0A4E0R9U7_FASHE|nr:LisH domain and HEAT repeat-containing protein [Fasciola hepatica]